MKRLMEEAAARHAETVHYSASAGIRVGGSEARKANEAGFWPTMLEGRVETHRSLVYPTALIGTQEKRRLLY